MKKPMLLILLLAVAGLNVQAGGPHGGSGYGGHGSYHGYHGYHGGTSISFRFGAYPYSAPFYSAPYYSYPYYPPYRVGYYDYGYARPNYAVGGTLLGALAGGIIGDSMHHQGWEGAAIGAAAGLVLGGVAESNARSRERAASEAAYTIPNAATANDAPAVSRAPAAPVPPVYKPSAMSGANRLFGR